MKKKDLLSQTRAALLEIAAELDIKGRTRMSKTELARAILNHRALPAADDEDEGPPPGRERRRKPVREKDLVRRSWREQQTAVQHAKFEAKAATAPEPPKAPIVRPTPVEIPVQAREPELPRAEDRIVLMVRDPYWIHVYWDVHEQSLREAKVAFGDEWDGVRTVLRVYDVTGVDFDGGNAHSHFDIEVGGGASNWYINSQVSDRAYCVDIGLVSPSGRFVTLARSNTATTPRNAPSNNTEDEEYMVPDWEFDKIYALSGGFAFDSASGSIELKELIEKALGAEIGSGAPGSMAISSPGERRVGKGRGFWFRVGTELIVYGATEPDAKVTVQGRPVELRPDGTFSLRFALPDGVQVIPARAGSADGGEEITITSTVEKSTDREN